MNIQLIEKQTLHPRGMLQVHSIFYTIQGEGPFSGRPAIFVRLAGCNLQCPMCDTDYTKERTQLGPSGLVEAVKEINRAATLVVITGGEPFRQNITPAAEHLLDAGFEVQIETNGTLYQAGFPYNRVTIVCSPKTGNISKLLAEHEGAVDAYKYVAQAGQIDRDGLPSVVLGHSSSGRVARPHEAFNGPVYLQPADEQGFEENLTRSNTENLAACVKSCKQHGYTLCLQVHKIIGEE